jgi:hypothetical protein
MNQSAKQLYEKMVDYKRFAVILLAVGVFLYLGVVLPTGTKAVMELNIMMCASSILLAGSIFFFSYSKAYKTKLLDIDEDEEYMK